MQIQRMKKEKYKIKLRDESNESARIERNKRIIETAKKRQKKILQDREVSSEKLKINTVSNSTTTQYRYKNVKFYVSNNALAYMHIIMASKINLTEYIENKIGLNPDMMVDIDALVLNKMQNYTQICIKRTLFAKLTVIAERNFTTVSRVITSVMEGFIKNKGDE